MLDRSYLWRWDRDRYKSSWLCLRPTEAQVQEATIMRLSLLGIPAAVVDAGAKKLRGRAIGALRRQGLDSRVASALLRGDTGILTGLVDIVGTIPPKVHRLAFPWGIPLFLEMKAPEHLEPSPRGGFRQVDPAGAPTPDQLAFLDAMHGAGACVGVLWSVDDLREVLP